jgi:UDP-N-acetylmuramoyl-L-alanyl-D-glutamate--2,6-diaminopimelate ligase
MLRTGIEQGGGSGKMTEVADRREAIERALGSAKKGDMVLITGMGHEQYRIVNGERLPWNDTAVVREVVGK